MKQLLPLIIIFLFLASCGRSKNTTASTLEQYDLTQAVSGSLADVFSDVELTPLRYGGGDYPKMVDRLIINDSIIFVVDNNHIAHIFDNDGKPISCSSEKMGEGPEEFPFAMCTTLNPYNLTIEVISPYKMHVYDVNMNFVNSVKLPTYAGKGDEKSFFFINIYDISSNIHAVRPTDSGSKIHIYDSEKNELISEFDYSGDVVCPINHQTTHFFDINNDLTLFVPGAMTYSVYSFSKEDYAIRKEIGLSMGDNGVSREYVDGLNLDELSLGQHLLTSDKDMIMAIMPTSDKLITSLKHGNTLRDIYYIFVDRKTGNKIRVDVYDNGQYNAPMFSNVGEGYAYAVMGKEDILERTKVLLDKKSQADSLLYDVEDDTFVLLKYKFKENL